MNKDVSIATRDVRPPDSPPPGDGGGADFDRQRYPYRSDPSDPQDVERANRLISRCLLANRGIIYVVCNRAMERRIVDPADRDEIIASVQRHLASKSLPRFDAKKYTKVSTFLYSCVRNAVTQEIRTLLRHRETNNFQRLRKTSLDDCDPHGIPYHLTKPARDELFDRRIEAAADQIRNNPELYFTASQVKVFKSITDNSNSARGELALSLGYERPSSLSMILKRMRARIASISIEDFPLIENGEVDSQPS